MVIDVNKCVGCGLCLPYCPVRAISIVDGKATVNFDLCVECGNCRFAKVCPRDAIVQQTLAWPRLIRAIFSNVRQRSPNTGIPGRGTQEMKTNDVTNRYPEGVVGITCEMGRPSTGASFRDVEYIAKIVVKHGVKLEKENPSFIVFREDEPGVVKDEFKNERALYFLIEGCMEPAGLPALLEELKEAQKHIDTVFSVDVICRMADGKIPAMEQLREAGVEPRPNGKTNVGVGRAG